MTPTIPAVSNHERRSIWTTAVTLLTSAVLLGTTACAGGDAGSSTGPTAATRLGIYALIQVNKKPIPFVIFRGPYYYADLGYSFPDLTIQVTGGELVLEDKSQFHMAVDLKYAAGGGEATGTKSFDGTWQVKGTDIVFTDGGGAVTGTLKDGYVMLFIDPGATGDKQTYSFRYVP
jgi:hypothetical protein